MEAGKAPAPGNRKRLVKTATLSAALCALAITASTACAATIDLGNALGPSGGYTSQEYYQGMLGGQPMTSAQQDYSGQEDQLRLLGFQAELSGDFALGQMFFRVAYGMGSPQPWSALNLAGGGSDVLPLSIPGGSDGGYGGGYAGDFVTAGGGDPGGVTVTLTANPVPEPSTWAMMLLGFVGLGFAGWRASRRSAAGAAV
jgi:PEP-CTERM motif